MTDFRTGAVFLILTFIGRPALSYLDSGKTKSCNAVFSAKAMKSNCCTPMKEFVDIIADCQKKSNSDEFTCSVSKCVVTAYKITTNGKIDEDKVKAELKILNKKDPASEPLNAQIEENCLNEQYMKYVTTDASCDCMKFQVCAFVSYLFGCQQFSESTSFCKTLANNVGVCKPVLAEYVEQINSKNC